ncbi:MAG: hypothetical protein EZS28_000939 [Streblomastix strix]|uniref:Uncharacterized protein n=1 Tax=Streblomastix strix TaxID=222440 RepID=A0A5J4X8F2_9EUKA|nr:MAG: hypothetical protein EZS28_000939 [Streblomastix strix]
MEVLQSVRHSLFEIAAHFQLESLLEQLVSICGLPLEWTGVIKNLVFTAISREHNPINESNGSSSCGCYVQPLFSHYAPQSLPPKREILFRCISGGFSPMLDSILVNGLVISGSVALKSMDKKKKNARVLFISFALFPEEAEIQEKKLKLQQQLILKRQHSTLYSSQVHTDTPSLFQPTQKIKQENIQNEIQTQQFDQGQQYQYKSRIFTFQHTSSPERQSTVYVPIPSEQTILSGLYSFSASVDLESLINSEQQALDTLMNKIMTLRPTVIISTKSVALPLLQRMSKLKISTVINMPKLRVELIAHSLNARIAYASNELSEQCIGICDSWQCIDISGPKYAEERKRMYIQQHLSVNDIILDEELDELHLQNRMMQMDHIFGDYSSSGKIAETVEALMEIIESQKPEKEKKKEREKEKQKEKEKIKEKEKEKKMEKKKESERKKLEMKNKYLVEKEFIRQETEKQLNIKTHSIPVVQTIAFRGAPLDVLNLAANIGRS